MRRTCVSDGKMRLLHGIRRGMKVIAALSLVFIFVLQLLPTEIFAAGSGNGVSKYDSINDFQRARWLEIQNAMLEKVDGSDMEFTAKSPADFNNMLDNDWRIAPGNTYFNWVDNEALEKRGITAWDGGSSSVPYTTDTYEYQDTYIGGTGTQQNVSQSITYQVYNVGNAKELRYVLAQTGTGGTLKINLTNDINLNGQEHAWAPISIAANRHIYIEGNGHTIYNMRVFSSNGNAGFFNQVYGKLIIKNLNFQSSMTLCP